MLSDRATVGAVDATGVTEALEGVLNQGDQLKRTLSLFEAQVHRLKGVRVAIDDEVS
ncbi:hypothetical protein [Streptomyces venezuelae]|uniref:hypothetical protein n=1 Tax=Streptomyces venezuelae TaxID=54571 RepID=UPI0036569187